MTTWANNTINKATDSVAGTSANTDATSPQTASNDDSIGTVAWSNPDNIKASDDSKAFFSTFGTISNYLKATNFGFSIPTGSTIVGIKAEIEQSEEGPGNATENSIKIVKGGTISGDDQSTSATIPASDTYTTYGGTTDLWGETWTAEDINLSTFGVVFSATGTSNSIYVDHIRITVYYTTAGTSATWTNESKGLTTWTND